MKIKTLTIHNLASIEDATINFGEKPLSNSEVFLISGVTGSGKSTILDAICLALYASTPRLENTLMQGDMPDADSTTKLNDPRQLMRRGTGEAWVKLAFKGNNGKHYEAMWYVNRSHKKANGNLQKRLWTLTIVETGETLKKKDEIVSEINTAVGLDFNQFCRTTMLAQGEFTKFLNSKDNDKSMILEKITGVDSYSRIGRKVYEITQTKEKLWQEAQRDIENVEVLKEEEIDNLNAELNELKRNALATNREKEKTTALRNWLKEEDELSKNCDKSKLELQEIIDKTEEEAFKENIKTSQEWTQTINPRNSLKIKIEAEKTQRELKNKIGAMEKDFKLVREGLLNMQQLMEQKNDELKGIETFLEKQAPLKEIYSRQQTINALIGTYMESGKKIADEKVKLSSEKERLAGSLTEALDNAKKAVEEKNDGLKVIETACTQLEKQLEAAKMTDLRKKKDEISNEKNGLGKARLMVTAFMEKKEATGTMQRNLEQKKASIPAMEQELEELKTNVEKTTIAHDAVKNVYDKQASTASEWSVQIRSKLTTGDTCPVCMQKITTALPHESEVEELMNAARVELEKARQELANSQNKYNKLEAEIKVEKEQIVKQEEEVNRAIGNLKNDEKALLEVCGKWEITVIDNETDGKLQQMEYAAGEQLERIKTSIAEGEKVENALKDEQKAAAVARKAVEKAQSALQKANDECEKCKADIKTSEALIDNSRKDRDKSSADIKTMVGNSLWGLSWETQPQEFASRLKEETDAYEQKVKEETLTRQLISSLNEGCKAANIVVEKILEAQPQWEEISATTATECKNITNVANSLLSKLITARTQLNDAVKRHDDNAAAIESFLENNPTINRDRLAMLAMIEQEEITLLQEDIQKALDEKKRRETAHSIAIKNQEKHKQERPELDEDEDEDAETEHTIDSLDASIGELDNKIKTLNEKEGAINQQLRQDQENKTKLGEKIIECEQRKKVLDKWSRLNNLIGDSTGNKFRNIALAYVLENLIHSANSYMATLSERYRLKTVPGTFIIKVEDAYQGFASRPASTISGGESFLVSLALALALSDISQQLRVDLLFIDEGFGTLSGEPLQNAITTLRSLHAQYGRQVGIISHVDELKEKIPVQIRVIQEGNSSASTISVFS